MRSTDETKLEALYEGMYQNPSFDNATYRAGDEKNPSSPDYAGQAFEDYIDSFHDSIKKFIELDYGKIEIDDIDIDIPEFLVTFRYIDEDDGSIQTTTEKVTDSDVGADLDPEPSYNGDY